MKILIDADGCPVVDITLQEAARFHIETIILCDTSHLIQREGARTITVSKGADSVDFTLVNLVSAGDLVITQDYGLAAMCLARGAVPIHQNGFVYDERNIDALLSARHASQEIRRAGKHVKGPPKRSPQENLLFGQTLRQCIQCGLRALELSKSYWNDTDPQ